MAGAFPLTTLLTLALVPFAFAGDGKEEIKLLDFPRHLPA